jgi:ElaB/YqjD/DUF883 family membrane-anchored ribosome-binding protein
MTNPKEQEAAASTQVEQFELTQDELVRALAGELDVDAMIEEAKKRASPHPTLESIRTQLEAWKASWHTNLRVCVEDRVRLRGSSAAKVVLAALFQDDIATARNIVRSAQPDEESRAAVEPLTDEEFRAYVVMKAWDSPAVACAVGMCLGSMLTSMQRDEFDFNDICKLATDPVFIHHGLMGKLDWNNVRQTALQCIQTMGVTDSMD